MSRRILGVIGAGTCSPEIAQMAGEVGERIAGKGAILICGGLFGVMEAACRGAKSKGGTTIGILPGQDKSEANSFVDIPIATGMGEARNIIIVRSAAAVIAIGGEHGTLSEIAFCLKFKVPLVGIKTWDFDPAIVHVDTPGEAVDKAFEMIE